MMSTGKYSEHAKAKFDLSASPKGLIVRKRKPSILDRDSDRSLKPPVESIDRRLHTVVDDIKHDQ